MDLQTCHIRHEQTERPAYPILAGQTTASIIGQWHCRLDTVLPRFEASCSRDIF